MATIQIYDDYGDIELSQCGRFTRKLLESMLKAQILTFAQHLNLD